MRGPLPTWATVATASKDEVIYQGKAEPGSRVMIGTGESVPAGTLFRWTQIEGPTVSLSHPNASKIEFTVPAEASKLAFLVKIRNEHGERSVRVNVPVSRESGAVESRQPSSGPIADGGDDQVGLVGRRITLNGTQSQPIGKIGYRWLPISGPTVTDVRIDGGYYSFVPTAPGIYRFALLVGFESRVSEPDLVTVEVGHPASASVAPEAAPSAPPAESTPFIRSLVAAVALLPRGPETGDHVADVFEAVANRVPLYSSFSELQSELSRRLDVIIPSQPEEREAWTRHVFNPLSQATAAELMAAGIDPRPSPAHNQALTPSQRSRLQAIYQGLADAFRPRPAKF